MNPRGAPTGGADPPLVSVIMPVYNGRRFLGATLPAVAAQTHPRMECIAADDGSTDDSPGILARHANWRVERVSRLGSNGARRAAVTVSRGDYLAFLDQDDLWHPEHLASCVALLEAFPEAPAAVGRRSRFQDASGPALGHRAGPPGWFQPWNSFPFTLIDSPSMAVVRRSSLERIGGWPETGGPAADCLAWWRLGAVGPLGVLPGRTVGIRVVAGSMSDVDRKARRFCLDNILATALVATGSLEMSRRSPMRNRAESLLSALGRVLDAFEKGDPIETEAIGWERAMEGQPDIMVLLGVRFLGWLLHPDRARSTGPEWRRLVESVLLRWPAGAPRTGREMRRWIAVSLPPSLIVDSLRQSPSRTAPWQCLAECLGADLARRIGRNADPLDLQPADAPAVPAERSA